MKNETGRPLSCHEDWDRVPFIRQGGNALTPMVIAPHATIARVWIMHDQQSISTMTDAVPSNSAKISYKFFFHGIICIVEPRYDVICMPLSRL